MKEKITNTILHFNNFLKRNSYSDDDNNVKMMKLLQMVYYIYVDLSFGKTWKHIHSKTTTEIQFFLKPQEQSFMKLTPCPQYKFIVALVSFQFCQIEWNSTHSPLKNYFKGNHTITKRTFGQYNYSYVVYIVSSNLIGSLSRRNWVLFTPNGVNNAWSKQNKIAGVNSRSPTISVYLPTFSEI